MVEAEYFFNGNERWRWIFPSPNYLGAFIAQLIPVVSALRWGCSRLLPEANESIKLRYISYVCAATIIEITLFIVLTKTYSRGSLVGVLGSMAFFAIAA